MTDVAIRTCILCLRKFNLGQGGRALSEWRAMICEACDAANSDGVTLKTYPHLLFYLTSQQIDVELNAKGRLPLPS